MNEHYELVALVNDLEDDIADVEDSIDVLYECLDIYENNLDDTKFLLDINHMQYVQLMDELAIESIVELCLTGK
jgi:hypothetical protein